MLDIKACLLDSGYKHIQRAELREDFFNQTLAPLTVVKNERFAFQMLIRASKKAMCCLDDTNYLNWDGLFDRVRIEVRASTPQLRNLRMRFEGYIADDAGTLTADPILEVGNCQLEALTPQAIWVDGEVLPEFDGKQVDITFDIYRQAGFGDEIKVMTLSATLEVADVVLPDMRQHSVFHFYLWQQLSNWAKTFGTRLWTDEHFEVIENMVAELSSVGATTAMLVVSEFPWNGQFCSKEKSYPSDLYEHNIVKVFKGKDGKFYCDFTAMDRYLKLCEKYNMCRDIDLMGLMYIWAGVSEGAFYGEQVMYVDENPGKNAPGNPLDDYSDGIRIRYYDEADGLFKYMHKKQELGEYVRQLFDHFVDLGVWDRVALFSDEPIDEVVSEKWMSTIKGFAPHLDVSIKIGVFEEEMIRKFGEQEKHLVTHLSGYINKKEMVRRVRDNNRKRGGKFDWAICCTPDHPNNFIISPLIESRITSWMTYHMDMDGYENWKFAVWPSDPWNRISYRYPMWLAGDMYYVYPGHNGKPCSSIRWENIRLGLQDYNLFCMLEKQGVPGDEIRAKYLDPVLGNLEDTWVEDGVYATRPVMHYDFSLAYNDYERARREVIRRLEAK